MDKKGKKRVLGVIQRTTRQEDGIVHLLCKCGESTQILIREFPVLLQRNSFPIDTSLERVILEDCPNCKPKGNHGAVIV